MECVYWIHNEDETDILSEGYVGISNDPERRFGEHGEKFGTVKEVIFQFATREEAERKEFELRPKWFIGKNIAPGGQAGNRPKGIHTSGWKHSEESRRVRSERLKGNTLAKNRARKCVIEGVEFAREKDGVQYLADKYEMKYATARYRWKNNVPFDQTRSEIMSVKTRESNLKRNK